MFKFYAISLLHYGHELMRVLFVGWRPRNQLEEVTGEAEEFIEVAPEAQEHLQLLVPEQGIIVRKLVLEDTSF